MNDSKPPKRRWYQFSLRTMGVLLFVGCVVFALIAARIDRARKNRRQMAVEKAVAEIEKLGGLFLSDYEQQRPATWLEELLDDPGAPDNPIGILNVWGVNLDSTNITDAGLEHLKGLTKLKDLSLDNTKVTAEGAEKLRQALPNCQISHY